MSDKTEAQTTVVTGGTTSSTTLPTLVRVVAGAVALILLLVILFFIPATKPLINRYLGIATPQTTGPCSGNTQLINSHNSIMRKDGVIGITNEVKDVRAKSGYATDPTCVYISMLGYYGMNATQNALSENKVLDRLKAEGKLPAKALNDGVDRNELLQTLRRAANEKPENPYAQG